MRYEFWLSSRYLFAKRREKFVSIIAALSIGGVAIGVLVLLVALAVMSGLHYGLKERFIGVHAHVIVESPKGNLSNSPELFKKIESVPEVVGVSPFAMGQAVVRLPDQAFGVLLRGIDLDRDHRISRLAEYLIMGRMPENDDQVLIGSELAGSMTLRPGSEMQLISPVDGQPRRLKVSGIFRSGMFEFDALLVATSLARAQDMFGIESSVSGIGVKLKDLDHAKKVKAALEEALGPGYNVKLWTEMNPTLFAALELEKIGTFVLLTLIVLVASANIISTLVMMVNEKTRDIGILKSIGATNKSVWLIFTIQGIFIGLTGILLGAGVAGALIWSLDTYHFIRLPGNIYYLDYLPVRVEFRDWWITFGAAMGITLLSTLYPARKAAQLMPVDALRYE